MEIAQVLADNTWEFVNPKIQQYQYNGVIYHIHDQKGKLDIKLPKDTIVYYQNTKVDKFKNKHISTNRVTAELFSGFYNAKSVYRVFPRAAGIPTTLTDLDRLNIAFQADGSFGSKSKTSIRFNMLKQRKIDRLIDILDRIGTLQYKIYSLSDKRKEFNIINAAHLVSKNFEWVQPHTRSAIWAQEFIEELSYWDATRRSDIRFKYDTTNTSIPPIIDFISVVAGYSCFSSHSQDNRSVKFSDIYTSHIMKTNLINGQAIIKDTELYEGPVYTIDVPNGLILTKNKKAIFVCGT